MARMNREEVFAPDEVAIVHVMNRVVRRCFLLGNDPVTGKNYDHRKDQIEALFERFAALFGLDLLVYSILSNHFHAVLRSRPDVVATWSDTEVARRWMLICPLRSDKGFLPMRTEDYLELLDWTAREVVRGKRGHTPTAALPILQRLSLDVEAWRALVHDFGRMFYHAAGKPRTIDDCRSRVQRRRFHVPRQTRRLLSPAA